MLEAPTLGAKIHAMEVPGMTGFLYYLMAGIFIVFSFWNGLYFDKSFMAAAIYWFVVAIVFLVWVQRSGINIGGWLLVDYLVLSYFGVYFLSSLFPANVEYAVLGFVRGISYLFIYVMIRIVSSVDDRKHLLLNGLILSGTIFGLYGLANGFGTLHVNGTVFDPQMRRLASNFEYSNTYAIYQAIMFVLSISMASFEAGKLKKWLYSIASYILITSMILTYSRGTWLVFVAMLLFLFIMSPNGGRGKIAIHTLIPVSGLLGSIVFLSKATLQEISLLGWTSLVLGIIGVVVLAWGMSAIGSRLTARQWRFGAVGSGIVAVVGVALMVLKNGLPENLVQRFQSINFEQFSVVQRFVFYKDGLKILTEHPVLGAGPNAWPALYQRYQSYPYVSRQSHSFLIDTIMSVGILGTLVFLALLVLAALVSIRSSQSQEVRNRIIQSALLSSLLGLLGHGVIDFDFSYGTINFLMWTLIALLLPKLTIQRPNILSIRNQTSPYQKSLVYSGIIFLIAGGIVAGGYLLSNQYLAESNAPGKTPEAALTAARNASAMAPYRANVWLNLAKQEERIYNLKPTQEMPTKIKESTERAIAAASHDPAVLREASGYLGKYGGGLQTVEVARQAWENGRYQIQYPEQYLIFTELAATQLYSSDKAKAKEYFQQTIETYHEVEKQIAGFKDLPPVLHVEYKYDITPTMEINAGEAAYFLGKYDDASRFLQPVLNSKNPKEQAKAKAILAAIEVKKGQPIDASFVSLMNQDKQLNQYFTFISQASSLN